MTDYNAFSWLGDRVVATEIDGQITAEGMKALIERLQSIVDRGEKADAQ